MINLTIYICKCVFRFVFLSRINTLLDEHAPNHKHSIKEIFKAKPWVNKNIYSPVRESDRLFKCYCNENNLTLVNHNKYKSARKNILKVSRKPGVALNQL